MLVIKIIKHYFTRIYKNLFQQPENALKEKIAGYRYNCGYTIYNIYIYEKYPIYKKETVIVFTGML